MFAVKRLIEPNVVRQAVVVLAPSGQSFVVLNFGTILGLHWLQIDGSLLFVKNIPVGSIVVLLCGGCKGGSFLVLTEDAELLLIAVDLAATVDELQVNVVHRQMLPIDVVSLTPPPADVPTASANADGSTVALFALKGFVHIVHVDKILASSLDQCPIVVHQLDKANLQSVLVLEKTAEPAILPFYEGQLATLKGFYVSRFGQMQRLADPAVGHNVGGVPLAVIGLAGGLVCVITQSSATSSRRTAVCFRSSGPKEPYTVTLPDNFSMLDPTSWAQPYVDVPSVWVIDGNRRLCLLDLRREECRDECSAAVEFVEISWPANMSEDGPGRPRLGHVDFVSRPAARRSTTSQFVLVGASSGLVVLQVEPGTMHDARVTAVIKSNGPLTAVTPGLDGTFFLGTREAVLSSARIYYCSPHVASLDGFHGVKSVFLFRVDDTLQWRSFIVVSSAYSTRSLFFTLDSLVELDHRSVAGTDDANEDAYLLTWDVLDDQCTLECEATFCGCEIPGAQRAFLQVTPSCVRLGVSTGGKGAARYHDRTLQGYSYSAAAAAVTCGWTVGVARRSDVELLMWTQITEEDGRPLSYWYHADDEVTSIELCHPAPAGHPILMALGLWSAACVRFVSFSRAEGIFSPLASISLQAVPTSMVLCDMAPVLVVADAKGSIWSMQFSDPGSILPRPCVISDTKTAASSSKQTMTTLYQCFGGGPIALAVSGNELSVLWCCSLTGNLLRKRHIDPGDVATCTAVSGIALHNGDVGLTGLLVVADGSSLHFKARGAIQPQLVRQTRAASLKNVKEDLAHVSQVDLQSQEESTLVSHIFTVDQSVLVAVKTTIGEEISSKLIVVDDRQFVTRDALLLERREVVTCMEGLKAGLVAVGSGLVVAAGEEPAAGRVLVVALSPLRMVAKCLLDHAVYDIVRLQLPASSTGDDSDGDESLLAVANFSQVVILRMIGQELQTLCRASTTMRCTTVTVVYPYLFVADYDGGSEVLEVLAPSAGHDALVAAGGASDGASSSYHIARRSGQVVHGSGIISHKAFFNGEILRVDAMRNVTVQGLEDNEGNSEGASPDGDGRSTPTKELAITGAVRIGGVPTSLTIVHSVAPLQMRYPPFLGFNKHFEALFRFGAISSKALVTCSDGSLYILTTIPEELGRLLLRLQTAIVEQGFVPSLVPFDESRSTRSVNSSLHSQNFIDLNVLERFLLLQPSEREELVKTHVQPENADTVTSQTMCQLLLLIGLTL